MQVVAYFQQYSWYLYETGAFLLIKLTINPPPPAPSSPSKLHQRSHPIFALLAEAFLTNHDVIVPPFQPATVEMIAKMLALLPTATLSGLLRGAVALPLLSYAVRGPRMCCKSETEPPKGTQGWDQSSKIPAKTTPHTHTCIHPLCSVVSMFPSHVHRPCIFIITIIIFIIIIIIRRGSGRAAQATQTTAPRWRPYSWEVSHVEQSRMCSQKAQVDRVLFMHRCESPRCSDRLNPLAHVCVSVSFFFFFFFCWEEASSSFKTWSRRSSWNASRRLRSTPSDRSPTTTWSNHRARLRNSRAQIRTGTTTNMWDRPCFLPFLCCVCVRCLANTLTLLRTSATQVEDPTPQVVDEEEANAIQDRKQDPAARTLACTSHTILQCRLLFILLVVNPSPPHNSLFIESQSRQSFPLSWVNLCALVDASQEAMDPLDSDDDEELEALAVQLREGADEESEVGDRTEAPAKRRPGALVFCVCAWGLQRTCGTTMERAKEKVKERKRERRTRLAPHSWAVTRYAPLLATLFSHHPTCARSFSRRCLFLGVCRATGVSGRRQRFHLWTRRSRPSFLRWPPQSLKKAPVRTCAGGARCGNDLIPTS